MGLCYDSPSKLIQDIYIYIYLYEWGNMSMGTFWKGTQ